MLNKIRYYLDRNKGVAILGTSPFLIALLIGLYVGFQMIADIGGTKFMQFNIMTLSIVAPCGGLMYCFTYTIRDLIHKRLGKSWAQAAIVVAALVNVVQTLALWIMTLLPPPGFFALGDAWDGIFSMLPYITAASILAEVASELVDTEVYQAIWVHFGERFQWLRVVGSNVVGMALDMVLFAPLAFTILPSLFGASAVPLATSLSMGVWGKAIQVTLMLVSVPWIYLVKSNPEVK